MTLVLELPPELEKDLAARAAELQIPLEEYAVRVLAGTDVVPKPATGADVVAFWNSQGLVGSKPQITDPAGHARTLRQEAERRIR